jgi:hypothetical protein
VASNTTTSRSYQPSSTHTKTVAPDGATTNCDAPEFGQVAFDQKEFGHVTVHNQSRCTNDFLFVIFDAGDYDNQTLVSWASKRIESGGTADLLTGIPNPTCTKYQRDVFFGLAGYDELKMKNYVIRWSATADDVNVFYANGNPNQQPDGLCGPVTPPPAPPVPPVTPPVVPPPTVPPIEPPTTPPVTPPVEPPPPATCQDQGAINFGGLLPCVFSEGAVDVCPNLEGAQSTVPNGYTLVNGVCVPVVVPPPPPPTTFAFCHVEYHTSGRGGLTLTFVHEQNLNITLQAITNGHSDPAHHSYDHYGACTGEYAPVITQGPPQ